MLSLDQQQHMTAPRLRFWLGHCRTALAEQPWLAPCMHRQRLQSTARSSRGIGLLLAQATPATQRSAGRKRPAASQATPADEAKPPKRQRKPAAGRGRASRKVVDSDDSAEESAEAAEVVELGSDSDAGDDDDGDWTG